MDLLVSREPTVDGVTLGDLFLDGTWMAFTLEDAVRTGDKVAHETAIPAGRYALTITRSQRFGRMLPLVNDVPNFTGIRLHPGNTTADTAGCILLGLARIGHTLEHSRAALDLVQPKIARAIAKGEQVWLSVINAPSPTERTVTV